MTKSAKFDIMELRPIKIIYYAILGVVAVLALLLIASTFPLPGNYKILVVQSGSMEPTLRVGGLIVSKPAESYQAGDIITFQEPDNPNELTTHRIVEEKQEGAKKTFITKGDANEDADSKAVSEKDIVGKVALHLPYLGYAVNSVKQPFGFFLLIILPATMIIYDEIRNIKNEVVKLRQKKALAVLVFVCAGLISMNYTKAYFADTETSTGNVLQASDSFETDPFVDEVIEVIGTFGHCCDVNNLSSDSAVAEPLVTGAPDSPPTTNFIQISDNSSITLKFVNNKALPTENDDPDIRIFIYDALFVGSAEILVSQNCTDFISVGIHPDTANVDLNIEGTGLTFVKCVKLVDQVAAGDPYPLLGFDLDAVEALNSKID